MTPQQITERVEEIVDALGAAVDQIENLHKSMSGSVFLDDIRQDLQLAKSSSDIQRIYRHMLTTLDNDLPKYFALRKDVP
jgi:hypothetical protein